jgi:hypothetical protein
MGIGVIGAVWIGVSKVYRNKNPEEQKMGCVHFQSESSSYVLALVCTKPLQLQATAFEPAYFGKIATKGAEAFH